MNRRLSTRLLVWVGVPAALLFAFVVWNASRRSFDSVAAQTETASRLMARAYAGQLERGLGKASKVPEMIGLTLQNGTLETPEKVEAFLRTVVEGNADIYGSCIAFKPYGLDETQSGYAPYFYRTADGPKFEQLAKPDYDYFQWDWYRRPRDLGHAMWTEPYFDDGGGKTIMITYSVPFRRDGAFWGIATIDIAMTQLIEQTEKIVIGQTGYAFVISREGRFLACPDHAKIMTAMLQDANAELSRRMMANEEGFIRTAEPMQQRPAWIAYVPIQQGDLSLAIVLPEAEALRDARRLRSELLYMGAIGLAGLFGALIIISRSISRPIRRLADAAQHVAHGELDQRLNVHSPTEEVANLASAFNKMTRDLRMRMQELRYTTTVKERYEGELNAARSIQMSLVPKRFPAFPERPEIDIHALLRPAREVGGDLYDFYFLDSDWLCFLIGDVSGKGIPAALFMAVTKTLLKASSSPTLPLAQMMTQVNEEVCAQTDSAMFVSLVCCVLNTRNGVLNFCNAGHPAPILLRANGSISALEGEKDVALGAMSGLQYHAATAQLSPGDALFLYTDGVTEALDNARNFYTQTRLQIVLKDVAALPVEKITRGVVRDVRAFSGEREQSDDISVMAVRWLGPAAAVHSPST